MSKVKGSRQYRLHVTEYRPLLWWCVAGLILLFVGVVSWASFTIGHSSVREEYQQSQQMLNAANAVLTASKVNEKALQQKVANIRLGKEVDQQANEDVRQKVMDLEKQLAAEQAENSFYRNLMAPTEGKSGLTFGAIELIRSDKPRAYRYKIVLQQLATKHEVLKGSLSVAIVGRMNGMPISLALNQISSQVKAETIKLRFKYFQNIEGTLLLPEGFEPEGLELKARSSGKKPKTIDKRFGWLVEEV